jgi:hypothetical protein
MDRGPQGKAMPRQGYAKPIAATEVALGQGLDLLN